MDVFSENIDNDMSYEDYDSITVLVAADTPTEASEWIADNIKKQAEPFNGEFFSRGMVDHEQHLQTDLTEVGLITYY